MKVTYKFIREEGEDVVVELNEVPYNLYSQQFSIQLAEAIEALIGRRLIAEEDDWVWDLSKEEQSREF